MKTRIGLAFLLGTLLACGTSDGEGGSDAEADGATGADTAQSDAAITDVGDSPQDGGADAGSDDAGSDDAASDAGSDDAGSDDTASDAGSDDTGAGDAGDASSDIATDAEPDADAEDADPGDAAPDAAPDVPVPETCGDGALDEGEECDDGNDENNDVCTNACRLPVCGDGFVGLQPGAVTEREFEVENPFGVVGPVCDTGASCPSDTCEVGDDPTAPEHGICQSLGYARALAVAYGGDFGADADPAPRAYNWGCFDYDCFAGGNAESEGACGPGRMLDSIDCEGLVAEPCDEGENGFGPNQCRPGCELPVCGDGVTDTEYGEECDDANDVADDGCNLCRLPSCGDAVVQAGEECDDGNDDESDGCRMDCTFPECGDGVVQVGGGGFVLDVDFEDGELTAPLVNGAPPWFAQTGAAFEGDVAAQSADIDDGGATSFSVTLELAFAAELSFAYRVSSESGFDYLRVRDGSTLLLEQSGEVAWTEFTATLEPGEHTLSFAYEKDLSVSNGEDAAWIDALTVGVDFTYFEACDDGDANSEAPNACRPDCSLPACGDLIIDDLTEACDDGNRVDDDGCSNNCQLPGCGDGILQTIEPFGEACDEGSDNADAADACRLDCTLPTCGDGIVDTGEECDDENDVDDDGCSLICRLPGCGDGVVQAELGEECDDANDIAEDGCSNVCRLPGCGDGVLQLTEECDDGNLIDDDRCTNECLRGEPIVPWDVDVRDVLIHDCVQNGTPDDLDPENLTMDRSNNVFATQALDPNGLPNDALFPAEGERPETQLWWRNSNNGPNCRNTNETSGTFRFDLPEIRGEASRFVVFGLSTEGDSTLDVDITDVAGGETSASLNVDDWFDDPPGTGLSYLVDGLNRWTLSTNTSDGRGDPAIFVISVDVDDMPESVRLTPGGTGWFMFFGAAVW